MSLQQLSDVVVQLQSDLFNNKKFKILDDFFSADVAAFYPGINTSGRDELKTHFLVPLFNAFPDLRQVILEVMGDTGSIACRWTFTGTFKKAYQGYQPNNHKISWQGVSVYHVENGMITSVRSIFDSKPFYAALAQPQEAEGQQQ